LLNYFVAALPFLAGDTQGAAALLCVGTLRPTPQAPAHETPGAPHLLLSPPCISATGPPPPVSLQICDPIVRVRGHELEGIVIPAPYRSAADKHGL